MRAINEINSIIHALDVIAEAEDVNVSAEAKRRIALKLFDAEEVGHELALEELRFWSNHRVK